MQVHGLDVVALIYSDTGIDSREMGMASYGHVVVAIHTLLLTHLLLFGLLFSQ